MGLPSVELTNYGFKILGGGVDHAEQASMALVFAALQQYIIMTLYIFTCHLYCIGYCKSAGHDRHAGSLQQYTNAMPFYKAALHIWRSWYLLQALGQLPRHRRMAGWSEKNTSVGNSEVGALKTYSQVWCMPVISAFRRIVISLGTESFIYNKTLSQKPSICVCVCSFKYTLVNK